MKYQPGDSVGPYRITEVIGEGATGVVYRVQNSVTGRVEAMKILSGASSADPEISARFLREIQVQARLEHPHIAQVRTAFQEESTIVLVMEHVDGEPLSEILKRGRLSLLSAIRVAEQVLDALSLAHHGGVVHRDVKPANILVNRQGAVKLTDFGLAKRFGELGQTTPGVAVGTVYYMAPEQVRGLDEIDWRADLYSVGILFYEMITGLRPFDGAAQITVMQQQMETVAVPPSQLVPHLPKDVDALLDRALAKDPAKRFQSAAGFLAALRDLPIERQPRRTQWQYATYAAGLGALLLSAFALPPRFSEPELETLTLRAPAPPAPPFSAYEFSAPEPEPEIPAPVPLVRPQTAPRRPEASLPQPAPFVATRIINPDPTPPPAMAPEPIAARVIEAPPPLPAPRRESFLSESPAPPASIAREPLPPAEAIEGEKANWMRRTVGKFPRWFRRKDRSAEADSAAPKKP